MKFILKYSLLAHFIAWVFVFMLAQSINAAVAWQLQQRGAGTSWLPVGEYSEKLDCAKKLADEVDIQRKPENAVRCYNPNPSGSETMNFAAAKTFLTSARAKDSVSPPLSPTRTAFSHLWAGGYWGVDPLLLPCRGLGCLKNQPNPLTPDKTGPGACGLLILFQNLIYLAISIVLYIIVPIRFIWGGALILISAGSPERVGAGKKMIYNTLIGVLLVLGAFIIVNTFLWLLGNPLDNWAQIDCVP